MSIQETGAPSPDITAVLERKGFQLYVMEGKSIQDMLTEISGFTPDDYPEISQMHTNAGEVIAIPDLRRTLKGVYMQDPDVNEFFMPWEELIDWATYFVATMKAIKSPQKVDLPTAAEIGEIEFAYKKRNSQSLMKPLSIELGERTRILTSSTLSGERFPEPQAITFSANDKTMDYQVVSSQHLNRSVIIVPVIRLS